jgi:hypothetical protein
MASSGIRWASGPLIDHRDGEVECALLPRLGVWA